MRAKNTNSQKKNIVLVGPLRPFRGGVAQYNEQLARNISDYCKLSRVSFKRLYPAFLYPGKSDKEPGAQAQGSQYANIIDAYWPPSLKKAASFIIQQKPDIVIVTWWTLFWQPGLAYLAQKLRKNGIKVVYICHNVFDHDASKTVQFLSKRFLAYADGYIVHSSDEKKRLKYLYPGAKVLNTNTLPVSTDFPKAEGCLSKRGKLELLFFGFIRPYKGLDVLLDAMSRLTNEHEVYLTIVGEIWGDKEAIKQKVIALGGEYVELHDEYVSSEQAAEYFSRADVVVLPYKSATGSAVAAQAFFYGKPILGTSVSGIRDVVKEGRTGWLVNPNSSEELADTITKLTRANTTKTKPHIQEFNKNHSWAATAKLYVDFFKTI